MSTIKNVVLTIHLFQPPLAQGHATGNLHSQKRTTTHTRHLQGGLLAEGLGKPQEAHTQQGQRHGGQAGYSRGLHHRRHEAGRQSGGPSGARKGKDADTTCRGAGRITGTRCIHRPLTGGDPALLPAHPRACRGARNRKEAATSGGTQSSKGDRLCKGLRQAGVDRTTEECKKSSNCVTSYRGIMVALKRSSVIVNDSCFPSLAGRPLPARPSHKIAPLIARTRENTQKAKQLDLTHSG